VLLAIIGVTTHRHPVPALLQIRHGVPLQDFIIELRLTEAYDDGGLFGFWFG
jgi:hypothetical protein